MRAVAVMLALLILTGCRSGPPTRFYALDAVSAPQRALTSLGAPLKVDAVHIPPTLDREEVVRGESHNELRISALDRWAGDFGEMARRVLTQDLQSRLPAGAVIAPDLPAPADARGLVVDLLTFEPQSSGEVVLTADWSLMQGSPATPVLQRSVRLAAPAGESAGAQAASMSELLGKLADDIITEIASNARIGAARAAGGNESSLR